MRVVVGSIDTPTKISMESSVNIEIRVNNVDRKGVVSMWSRRTIESFKLA